MKIRQQPSFVIGHIALGCAAICLASPVASAQTRYTASWASVDTHTPAPEWFQDAKFGVYYHWGAFGVAEYGSEWYPRNMYNKGSGEYNNQMSKYGDPFADWPYNKFITGGTDKKGNPVQFAPKLKSAGGTWDPDEWAQILIDAGARFAGPVAEHHDGFSMWDSKANEWNSNDKGPKLNLAKLQADAYRKRGLKFLMAMHHAYNFTGYYQYAPKVSDPSLQKLFGQLPTAQENQLWYDKLKEIIDEFLPDIIWEDFNLSQVDETKRLQFLSYYYNAALDAGKEVVATYKDGYDNKGEVLDYERGGPGDISTPYWLTDDAVSPSSWCYTQGMGYYTPTQEVHTFVDHVSKGGNLLLNISPLPDGTIPQQQRDILTAFGTFLKVAGEAIYNTRAWVQYGEGPTKIGGGSFTGPKAMTASDIRYTKSKDGDAVYAIIGGWPTAQITMTAVTSSRFPLGSGKVFLFGGPNGQPTQLQATQDGSGLHVTLPGSAPYQAVAYAIKISKSGTPPAPPAWIGGADGGVPVTDGGGVADAASGAGGSGAGGAMSAGGATGSGGASAAGGASGRGGSSGTGDASASGGSAGNAGGTSSMGGQASGGVASGGSAGGTVSGSGGVAGSAGKGGAGSGGTAPQSASSGCSCTVPGSGGSSAGVALLVLGFAFASVARRRRR